MKYTDASHNLNFRLKPDQWREDLSVSSAPEVGVTGYQEVGARGQRPALAAFCKAHNRGLYLPDGGDTPISWDRDTFDAIPGEKHNRKAHDKAGFHRYLPARYVTAVGLRHKATDAAILRVNVHPTARATNPAPNRGARVESWADWAIAQLWLDVLAFTARQASREVWDAITLGGDYNADLITSKADQWYYPSQLLPALYVRDTMPRGLDHLQHTHGSDLQATRRWAVPGHTDHRLHFSTRRIVEVPDFPA